jgi:hypothetical protein
MSYCEALLYWARSGTEAHGFDFERWPGFYAFYGFVACFALVLAAKQLRRLLMRPERYYEDQYEALHAERDKEKRETSSEDLDEGDTTHAAEPSASSTGAPDGA